MATLVSPGVSVSVIDESVTASAGEGTVPFILIATAQDKTTPDGADIAVGTTQANAGKLYLMTSQRELLQAFGDPTFQSVGGNQIHGSPLNEYGLLAAYSYLGSANRAYIARADIDLAQLEASVIEPDSAMAAGTIWLDTAMSQYGIHVVTDVDNGNPTFEQRDISIVFESTPDNAVGADGEYAVSFGTDDLGVDSVTASDGPFMYYIKQSGAWVALESAIGGQGTSTYEALFKQPAERPSASGDLVVGDHWVKTSAGSGGASIVVSILSPETGNYVQSSAAMFAEYNGKSAEDQASEFYGDSLSAGDFMIDATATLSVFALKQYDGEAWVAVDSYYASDSEPRQGPEDGVLWYNADVGLDGDGMSTVDLLINNGTGAWESTSLPGYDAPGQPTVFLQSADPVGTGASLTDGDIWVDTDQLDKYPVIYKWSASKAIWNMVDNTDQTSSNGILFADARVAPDSTQLDIDAPDADAYPKGMLLWNTRFSTRNVKEWNASYLVDEVDGIAVYEGRWVSASGNAEDGSLYAGTDAQRAIVVKAMQAVLVSNQDVRSEYIFFNLMAAPGFPETIDEMITLNIDRKETGFIIGDSPMDLPADATSVQAWAQNSNGAAGNGQDGLISADPYLGVYYPSGLSTNTDGSDVVVPASHMMLRTMAFNDQVAYPWFAPAGLTRGRLTNASAVGYVDGEGEFVPVTLNQGQRDVLYTNNLNPLAYAPGEGITAFGQKTRNPFDSALSRINVARLINYIRYQAENLARPFLFEPNDSQTRDNVLDAFNRFMAELVTLRGLDDFLVVCDTSNNTAARIDRNELWIDIAIVPIKAIEFIYIPIRIRNTGGI